MLLAGDDKKSFEELTMQLCMFESNFTKVKDSSQKTQEALIATKSEKPKQEGKYKSKSRKEDYCNYCKRKGHWVRDCRKWISNRRLSKNKLSDTQSNTVSANIVLMSISEEVCTSDTIPTSYWIDNGATRHITNCYTYFVDFIKFNSPCGIKAAGNETLAALGKDTVKINRNLFSVLATQDRNQNSEFVQTPNECWLKVNSNVVFYGSRSVNGSLYKTNFEPFLPKEMIEVHTVAVDSFLLQLYHERWGHQYKRHVRNMLKKELGIRIKLAKELYEPCIYVKAHRLSFGTREKASEPDELISADVCGPFDESFQKKKYLVIFKDSFTKFHYGYLIKEVRSKKGVIAHACTYKVIGIFSERIPLW
ncbi:retrovirus-related Pol polyprotein from transposon TNT 1-94 [Trichonephila inaurata madagascariensis]|uniref:Retrovirus-related Pol polyprotein from transposon TNT 1-94 n=1 Tax=Trichonephila inaurata madagascariensis TaxID=2747483 RepID=A0A8X6X3G6_9ARAC|nr:retrovirus-related Pol polyprotein from transposon TNT 1-94 [Trichonephila inaurata madagascariensis]